MTTTAIQTEAAADNRRRSLWAIGADFERLDSLMDDLGDDGGSPEVLAAEAEIMAALESERAAKLDHIDAYLGDLAMRERAAREQAKRWADKAATAATRADRVRAMVLAHMQSRGETKIESAAGVAFSVRANGGKAAMTCDLDPDTAPDSLVIRLKAIDKVKVRAMLEAGEVVEGAALLPRGVQLRIS